MRCCQKMAVVWWWCGLLLRPPRRHTRAEAQRAAAAAAPPPAAAASPARRRLLPPQQPPGCPGRLLRSLHVATCGAATGARSRLKNDDAEELLRAMPLAAASSRRRRCCCCFAADRPTDRCPCGEEAVPLLHAPPRTAVAATAGRRSSGRPSCAPGAAEAAAGDRRGGSEWIVLPLSGYTRSRPVITWVFFVPTPHPPTPAPLTSPPPSHPRARSSCSCNPNS